MDLVTTTQVMGNVGEFIGAIAVVATLFYLALQVREGKKATEANTESLDQSRQVAMAQVLQNRVRTNVEISRWLAESDHLLRIESEVQSEGAPEDFITALNGLEPIDRARYVLYLRLGQWHMDSLFQLHEAGLLDDETYESSFSGVEGILETWTALDDAGTPQPLRPSFRREIERKLEASRSGQGAWGVMGASPTAMN
jgi:hypothetical protein